MNPQEEQEYQERMGSPEMEYLQHQTDFPEQLSPMTTLNTIIEEEKRAMHHKYDLRYFDGSTYAVSEEFEKDITTAMQRAYEAGRLAMGNEVLNSKEFKTLEESLPKLTPDKTP